MTTKTTKYHQQCSNSVVHAKYAYSFYWFLYMWRNFRNHLLQKCPSKIALLSSPNSPAIGSLGFSQETPQRCGVKVCQTKKWAKINICYLVHYHCSIIVVFSFILDIYIYICMWKHPTDPTVWSHGLDVHWTRPILNHDIARNKKGMRSTSASIFPWAFRFRWNETSIKCIPLLPRLPQKDRANHGSNWADCNMNHP